MDGGFLPRDCRWWRAAELSAASPDTGAAWGLGQPLGSGLGDVLRNPIGQEVVFTLIELELEFQSGIHLPTAPDRPPEGRGG